jgi:hypothetical protein
MRTMRIALSCVASTLALVALSTGAALASGPDDEKTDSLLLGGGQIDVDLEVDLELDLDLEGDTKHDDLDADVDADVAAEIDLSDEKAVDAVVDVEADADVDAGGHKALAPVDVDADADADATVAVVPRGDGRSGGITALVRVPALLDMTVLDLVDATAVSDLCAGVGIFADAPRCAMMSGGSPDASAKHGVTALVDAAASAGAIAGDVTGVHGRADACIGVGIGASAPTCTIASAPEDEGPDATPDEPGNGAPDGSNGNGTPPGSAPGAGGDGAAPAEDRTTDEVSTPGGGLPDTALIEPVGSAVWALVMLVVIGLAFGGRRRLCRMMR